MGFKGQRKGADGFIDRVRKACLVESIEISMKKDFIA
jgi:hypothetical protein